LYRNQLKRTNVLIGTNVQCFSNELGDTYLAASVKGLTTEYFSRETPASGHIKTDAFSLEQK